MLSAVTSFFFWIYLYVFTTCVPQFQLDNKGIEVFDQGMTGSCTANALAMAIMYEEKNTNQPLLVPSRRFIYYESRALEGSQYDDNGIFDMKDAFMTIQSFGFPQESEFPFISFWFITDEYPPDKDIYLKALDNANKYTYNTVVDRSDSNIKRILASGHAILIGVRTYTYTYNEENPMPFDGFSYIVTPPDWADQDCGHEMLIVGWDDKNDAYIVQNSWGTQWGAMGFGEIQKSYVQSPALVEDLYTVNSIS